MSFVLEPWQLLLILLAGWINRQQQALLEFQRLQIEALLNRWARNASCSPTSSEITGRQRQGNWPQGFEGSLSHRHSGYDPQMAS